MPLYDAYGREVVPELLKYEQSAPTFSGIRTIYNNVYPSVNLTPDKLTGVLRNADFGDPFLFLELCEEIEEKDPHYLGVLNKRKQTVSSLEIIVEPASKSRGDEFIADFVRDVLLDESGLNLQDQLYDILDGIGKGFSASEIIWDTAARIGGRQRWIPEEILRRDPRFFMFDWITGNQVLVRSLEAERVLKDQTGSRTYEMAKIPGGGHLGGTWGWNGGINKDIGIQPLTEPLAVYKFITHFGKAKSGLPIRSGLTRCVAWTYLFKNFAMKDWSTFGQRYGQPVRLGKYPPGATEQDKSALLLAVAGLGSDMSGIIPTSTEIEFLAPSSIAAQSDMFERYMNYLNVSSEILVLGSTLGTQMQGSSGSRAAAETHRDVERDIMEFDARRLGATLNRDLVRPLVDLNFGPPPRGSKYPRLRLGMPDDDDKKIFVDNVAKLAESGLRIGTKQIYQKLHLTAPEEGEEILTPPQKVTEQEPAPGDEGDKGEDERRQEKPSPQMRRRGSQRINPGSPAPVAELFAARLTQDHWKECMDPLMGVVLKEIQSATSYEDLEERLKEMAAKMDSAVFQDILRKALFNAEAAGRVGAPLE